MTAAERKLNAAKWDYIARRLKTNPGARAVVLNEDLSKLFGGGLNIDYLREACRQARKAAGLPPPRGRIAGFSHRKAVAARKRAD